MRLEEAIRYFESATHMTGGKSAVEYRQLALWLRSLKELRTTVMFLQEELLRVAGETPSETCRRTHVQCCNTCDDVTCDDNMNPKYSKKISLRKEIREKATALKARKKSRK